MSNRLIRQNRAFLIVVIVLILLLGLVLYFGGYQAQDESEWLQQTADELLLSAKQNIQETIADASNDLFDLSDLLGSKKYAVGPFGSKRYKDEVSGMLYDFGKYHKQFYKIKLYDLSGYEVLTLNNRRDVSPMIIPDSLKEDRKGPDSNAQQIIKLRKKKLLGSNITKLIENGTVAVIALGTPILDYKGERKGALLAYLDVLGLFKRLPGNTVIEAPDPDNPAKNNLIVLKADGTIGFTASAYDLPGRSGVKKLAGKEDLYYSAVEIFPGNMLTVTVRIQYPLWKSVMDILKSVSVFLFVAFVCLILVIVYINISRFKQLIRAQKAILFSLADITEWRDRETGHHLERARSYAMVLAKQLRKNEKYKKAITNQFLEDLYDAAPLHDIGKVAIPDSILLKEGSLTEDEYEKVKKHVLIGKRILQDVIDKFQLKQSFLIMAKNICTYHHEKYNGKGYPEGLYKDEIPFEARIFALCDAYDAIRSQRSFKGELSHREALRRIKQDVGSHFDPDVAEAFWQCRRKFWEISETYKA